MRMSDYQTTGLALLAVGFVCLVQGLVRRNRRAKAADVAATRRDEGSFTGEEQRSTERFYELGAFLLAIGFWLAGVIYLVVL
jgi:hypothetical protein